jgi:hypothetical protein
VSAANVQLPLDGCTLPAQCDELYSDWANYRMNQADKEEVRRLIAETRKGFPLWAKESLGFAVVMAFAAFITYHYIPAQIGSQTSGLASDISGLKESVATLKTDVSGIRQDLKDAINRALDRTYQGTQPSSPAKRGSLDLGNSAIQLANDLKLPVDSALNRGFGQSAIGLALNDPQFRNVAWQGAVLSLRQRTIQPDVSSAIEDRLWVKEEALPPGIFGNLVACR